MYMRAETTITSTVWRVLGALCVSSLALACSAAGDRNGFPESHGDEVSQVGGGGPGGSSGAGDGDMFNLDGGFPGTVPEEEACAQIGGHAEPAPLDVLILLDRSGSMYGSNWNGSVAALKHFVTDPASDGVNVGLLYFPVDMPLDGLVCNSSHYLNPSVPIGPLPQNAADLVKSIEGESPNGGSTPMYGALEGALFHATQRKDLFPTHKVIVVFASDGDPNSCPGVQNSIPTIAQLAKAALDYNGVETYVIAIAGASILNLDQIAVAGGTSKSYDVTGNIAQFSQKMAEIRTTAMACEYVIPAPPNNQPIEFDKVAVKHSSGAGVTAEIPHAQSANDCGVGPGWYYDNAFEPKKVKLCPASCQVVQGDPNGTLDVLFGCKPKLN
jgi:hypothetical protein